MVVCLISFLFNFSFWFFYSNLCIFTYPNFSGKKIGKIEISWSVRSEVLKLWLVLAECEEWGTLDGMEPTKTCSECWFWCLLFSINLLFIVVSYLFLILSFISIMVRQTCGSSGVFIIKMVSLLVTKFRRVRDFLNQLPVFNIIKNQNFKNNLIRKEAK